MNVRGAKKQTLLLSLVNGLVRAMGLGLRVWLSRLLGAEIMGISELAGSVHMLAITPLTSGLPLAVSRMTAKAAPEERLQPLLAGVWFTRVFSAALAPLLLLLSPMLARLMGDARVLPSLWFTAPCILILGYSASLNGYCYGMEQSLLPAGSELVEQIARVGLSMLLLTLLNDLTAPWLAAVPVACTMLAELLGLWFVLRALGPFPPGMRGERRFRRPLFQLAFPTTLTRLIQTALRSAAAILIPLRLQASGLSPAESTARLGMLNGMVMPLLLLPGIFTSALAMVAIPKLAKAEEQPRALRRLLWQCTGSCTGVGALCAAVIWFCASFLASAVYRQADLGPLFRLCAPLTVLLALDHVSGSVLGALGQQKYAMYGASAASLLSLALICLLAALPVWRLHGVILAHYAAHGVSILWNGFILFRWFRQMARGDKSDPSPPSPGRPNDKPPAAASKAATA